jgi:hypothetical protein
VWHGTADSAENAQKSGEDVSAATATITNLTNGTTYYVWIKAKNSAGTSGFSPAASGTPQAAAAAPAIPAAPAVTAGDRQLAISWTAVTGATAYEVWHGTANDSGAANKFEGDVTTGASAVITSLANGTTYYVWVKAKNSVGTSGFSPAASGTPQAAVTAPAAPATPAVSSADRQLTISWAAVAQATAYEVWYGTADSAENAQKSGEDVSAATATITNLTNGTTYYVWVKAKNSAGTSSFSPAASGTPQAAVTAPDAPAAPVVTAGDGQLTISWTAVEGAVAYEVWHGTADSAGNAQKSGEDETAAAKTITGLDNGTTYYVWVKAKNSAGTSGFSPAASGTPQAAVTAPDAPAAPVVTAGNRQLAISWTAVEGAAAYEVWYGTTDNAESAQKSGNDVIGAAKTITGLANGTTYYVWVKTKNSVGTSGFSPSASGTPQAPAAAPAAPAAPTVSPGDGQLTVSWTAVAQAAAYEVWYGTANSTGGAQKSGDDETGITKTITGLANGTTYYVWVKAKNSAGTSGFSPAASRAPLAPGPGTDDATLSRFRPAGPNKLYRQHIVPKFTAANENYTLSVDYWVDTLQLEVTTAQTGATVASPAATATSQSGKAFTLSYTLNNGGNNIPIIVTAPDTVATKTYTIVINRDTFYGGSMATCTGIENVIPSWLFGFWSFVYDSSGNTEEVTITDEPVMDGGNLGRLEFGMGFGAMPWVAGDIAYAREFSSRSGILILQLDPDARDSNSAVINDPTPDGKGYYAIYYFDKVGNGGLGTSARIFQSNQIGSTGGVNAYATLEEAKEKFMVDEWHRINLTTIGGVGDPQIKRPDDWVWDGVTVDYWND